MRLAVIGGGWAGIAASVELAAAGRSVVLFEAGRRLGGRARSIDLDGRRLDNGQHILLGAYRDTLALMARVGAEPAALLQRLPLQILDNAGFRLALPRLPPPINLAWGLLSAAGVGLREKLATARWMDALKSRGFQVSQDTTVAAWLDAAGQTGTLRQRLWAPLCLAALNTPAERASARIFAHVLRDSLGSSQRGDTDLLLPHGGLDDLLPLPAAGWLARSGAEIRTGWRVRTVSCAGTGILVDGEEYDGAVIATAPQHTARLLPELQAMPADHEPIATVYLAYSKATALSFPLLNLQGGIGQWVVDRGQGLLACVLSGHGDWEALPDQELATRLHRELGLPSPPGWHRVIREKRATFSCRPNLLRPAAATKHPRLWLAGDFTWEEFPATLEGAVRSGLRAARGLLSP